YDAHRPVSARRQDELAAAALVVGEIADLNPDGMRPPQRCQPLLSDPDQAVGVLPKEALQFFRTAGRRPRRELRQKSVPHVELRLLLLGMVGVSQYVQAQKILG